MPVTVVDAPSNLGLRPPLEGSVPGCYKAGWALRNAGLLTGLNVSDGGVVIPPRYESAWTPGDGDRNADAIAAYSYALADHLEPFLAGSNPLFVIGGDCSILIGECLALRRRGRYGLVFIDGHSDFRHPNNSPAIGTAAGEDLAIVTNRGDARITNLDGLGPLIDDRDIVVVGTRPDDEYAAELDALGVPVWSVPDLRQAGPDLPDLISGYFDLEKPRWHLDPRRHRRSRPDDRFRRRHSSARWAQT